MNEIRLNGLNILRFDWDFIASHMYVIRDKNDALIVDPVDTDEVRNYITNENVRSCTVLLTHEHYDHISGVELLRDFCVCNVICSRICADNIRSSRKNHSDKADVIGIFNSALPTQHIEPFVCEADTFFDDRMQFIWHGHEINIFATPGHSEGSVCIVLDGEYMFSGDTLLEVPTITRLPGGNRNDFMTVSLPKLRELRFCVKRVFPGHGETASLDELLRKYDKQRT